MELGLDTLSKTGAARELHPGHLLGRLRPTGPHPPTAATEAPTATSFIAAPASPCTADQLINVAAVKLYVVARSIEVSPGHTRHAHLQPWKRNARALQRPLQAACVHHRDPHDQRDRPQGNAVKMPSTFPMHRQGGAALIVGLIMLVLITLAVTAGLHAQQHQPQVGGQHAEPQRGGGRGQSRHRGSGGLAAAAGRGRLAFAGHAAGAPQSRVDINNDGTTDYTVDIAPPTCVRATKSTDTGGGGTVGPGRHRRKFFHQQAPGSMPCPTNTTRCGTSAPA